jgi:chaperone required for assembly of F1-ATPase
MAKKVVRKSVKKNKKVVKQTKKPAKPKTKTKAKVTKKPVVTPKRKVVVVPRKNVPAVLEAESKIRQISLFEMNEIVGRLVQRAKTRKRNRNTIE